MTDIGIKKILAIYIYCVKFINKKPYEHFQTGKYELNSVKCEPPVYQYRVEIPCIKCLIREERSERLSAAGQKLLLFLWGIKQDRNNAVCIVC